MYTRVDARGSGETRKHPVVHVDIPRTREGRQRQHQTTITQPGSSGRSWRGFVHLLGVDTSLPCLMHLLGVDTRRLDVHFK